MAEGPGLTLRARNESRVLAQAEAAVAAKPFDHVPVCGLCRRVYARCVRVADGRRGALRVRVGCFRVAKLPTSKVFSGNLTW